MSDVENTESRIVQRALSKDRAALEELLLLRYDWLAAVAYRAIPAHLHRTVNSDEVLQEAFIRILRGFSTFEPHRGEASLFNWLKTVVQNTARDALRTHHRTKEIQISTQRRPVENEDAAYQDIADMAVSRDLSASVVARGQELKNAMRIALADLDPKHRQVIEMLYFQQRSLEEIAEEMAVTVGAVRGYRSRAHKKIRESFVRLSSFL